MGNIYYHDRLIRTIKIDLECLININYD